MHLFRWLRLCRSLWSCHIFCSLDAFCCFGQWRNVQCLGFVISVNFTWAYRKGKGQRTCKSHHGNRYSVQHVIPASCLSSCCSRIFLWWQLSVKVVRIWWDTDSLFAEKAWFACLIFLSVRASISRNNWTPGARTAPDIDFCLCRWVRWWSHLAASSEG